MNLIKKIVISVLFLLGVSGFALGAVAEEYEKQLFSRLETDLQAIDQLDQLLYGEEFEGFVFALISKRPSFQASNNVYANRPSGLSSETEQLAKDAEAASAEFLQGIELLTSLPEDFTEAQVKEAALVLDNAIIKYGELALGLSGGYFRFFFVYLAGTLVGAIGFLVMLIKLKKLDRNIAEGQAKAKLWLPIRTGFIWIGLGFGITLAGYLFMSGTYYIFYGLGLYGAYLIITGVYQCLNYKGNWEQFLIDDRRAKEEKLRAKQEKNKRLTFRNPFKRKLPATTPTPEELNNNYGLQSGPDEKDDFPQDSEF